MKQYFNPVISFLFLLFFTGITSVEGQNISINADGSVPDNSAMLDISSSTRGLLVPRMTFLERTLILNPANSLLIYQTDNTPGYYYNSGTATLPVWVQLGAPDNLGNHIATTNIQLGTNYLSGDGDSEGIYIDNTGNIGVGTATPSGKIDIVDNTEEFSINITNSTSSATDKKGVFSIVTGGGIGDSYGIYGEANAASGDKFGVFGGATGAGGIKFGLYGDATGAGTNWAGYFNDGNVYIDNLLGIGTTPSNALSVAGNIDVTSTNFLTTTIESSNIDGAWLALGNTSTGGKYYQLVSTGSNNAQGAGKLLIGYGAAANGVDGLAMTLADNRVGIGTSAPDSSLTVVGGVKATYFTLTDGAASGSVLTSDANGVATWQTANGGVFEKVGGVIRDTTSSYDSDFVIGSPQLDDDGIATHDNRLFFDKSLGAIRAGGVNGADWNEDSLGLYSTAFGENIKATGERSTVSGGQSNVSSGRYSTIGGGLSNTSTALNTTVAGGNQNNSTANVATISGGQFNNATNVFTTIGGGNLNTASGQVSTIGGGQRDTASGQFSTIGGGQDNTASNTYSTIGGGNANTSSGISSIIGGGDFNTASGSYSTVGGGQNNTALDSLAVIGGGQDNTASGKKSTVSGGEINIASGTYSTISGGRNNLGSSAWVSISGGGDNTASGIYSTVGGGRNNLSSGSTTTIGGGQNNTASNFYGTIGGGANNSTSGNSSTIGGGQFNYAIGDNSAIIGGAGNVAQSYGEVVFGIHNDTLLVGGSPTLYNLTDRLLVIGNGTALNARSNALVMLKNGNTTLNGELTLSDGSNPFTLPNSDGMAGQILQTDGSGAVTWEDAASGFGSGTLGQLTYFTADDSLRSSNELFWDEASDQLRLGVTSEDAKLTVTGADTTTVFLRNNLSGFSTGTAAAMDIALSGANRFNYGLNLNVSGATFQAKGIRADVTGTSSTSVFGVEITTDQTGTGSSFGGIMLATGQDGGALGLRARGSSVNSVSYGIDANAGGTGTSNYAVYGAANGAATNNYGVHGVAINATGNNYGVYGNANGGTGVNYAGYFNIGNVFIRDTLILNETFRISNGAAVGNVLVSDANGNASWQAPSGSSDLSAVLNAGSDAGNDSILNLNTLTIGSSRTPVTSVEIDSMLTISGATNGLSLFGSNIYESAGNVRYLNDGFGDAYLSDVSGISGIFHWPSGTAGSLIPGDPASFVRLEDSAVIINGDPQNFEIRLKGIVEVDSIRVNGLYSLPNNAPALGEILQYDGTNVNWAALSGDNLGNHTATTNVQLGTNYLSGDGDNEGIFVNDTGNVGIGTAIATSALTINTGLGNEIQFTNNTNAEIVASTQLNISTTAISLYEASEIRLRTSFTDRLTILNGGDVGIGTITPSGKLDVFGDGSFLGGLRVSGTTAATVGASIYIDGANQDWTIYGSNNSASSGANKLVFRDYTNAADRMAIDNLGNVGIGTTNPNALLQLNTTGSSENLRLTSTSTGTSTSDGFSITNNGTSRIAMRQHENANWQFLTHTGATALTIAPTANIGIGTSTLNNLASLEISGTGIYGAGIELGNGGSRVALTNSNGNAFQIIKVDGATTTHLTINNASGNVGLGTTNPTSRLEVIGDVEIPAANDYTYSTAKTHYQSYAPTAFNSLLPDQYDFGTFIASAYYGYFRSGGTAFGYATVSVNLPDGARVTELEGWIYDNSSTNPVRVSLQRQALGSSAVAAMARVESSALNTSLLVQNITDNTISNAVIDNQNYAYFLFFTGRQNSADTRLYGTRITYTVTEAD